MPWWAWIISGLAIWSVVASFRNRREVASLRTEVVAIPPPNPRLPDWRDEFAAAKSRVDQLETKIKALQESQIKLAREVALPRIRHQLDSLDKRLGTQKNPKDPESSRDLDFLALQRITAEMGELGLMDEHGAKEFERAENGTSGRWERNRKRTDVLLNLLTRVR